MLNFNPAKFTIGSHFLCCAKDTNLKHNPAQALTFIATGYFIRNLSINRRKRAVYRLQAYSLLYLDADLRQAFA
ncbi:hypothetical protein CAMRE0001_2158 [Campylobacter rectus RM3267]|uniref:Uncharacterized protein n=1 Tax=Campylobacter rectus RM3267 TaxID=553218 RepID=B9D462_CAMRE|nr:hypothetical protein CAMRE0001_2158 [Campylobacter rectus RM3267]